MAATKPPSNRENAFVKLKAILSSQSVLVGRVIIVVFALLASLILIDAALELFFP
jgi:hypothetical protein